jgi:hypothetical protein
MLCFRFTQLESKLITSYAQFGKLVHELNFIFNGLYIYMI